MDAKPQLTMPKVSTAGIGDLDDDDLQKVIDWLDSCEASQRATASALSTVQKQQGNRSLELHIYGHTSMAAGIKWCRAMASRVLTANIRALTPDHVA